MADGVGAGVPVLASFVVSLDGVSVVSDGVSVGVVPVCDCNGVLPLNLL